MTDFLEKFFYTARVGLAQMKTMAKVKDACVLCINDTSAEAKVEDDMVSN